MQELDFTRATLKDVPLIVRTIQSLRKIQTDSQVNTRRTQSQILRQLPAVVLAAVALELNPNGGAK